MRAVCIDRVGFQSAASFEPSEPARHVGRRDFDQILIYIAKEFPDDAQFIFDGSVRAVEIVVRRFMRPGIRGFGQRDQIGFCRLGLFLNFRFLPDGSCQKICRARFASQIERFHRLADDSRRFCSRRRFAELARFELRVKLLFQVVYAHFSLPLEK